MTLQHSLTGDCVTIVEMAYLFPSCHFELFGMLRTSSARKSLFRPKREICLDPSHSLGMTTSYPGDHDTVCGGRARVSAVMLECGNVACILRVEEGAKKYDGKKNSLRGPDYLIFGCC